MDKLNKAIADIAYIFDCLRNLRAIYETGDCNNCGIKSTCAFKPRLGQMVRYNCPFYEKNDACDKGEDEPGHWTDKGSLSCRCSKCGCKSPKEYPYCPNCGTRMEK